jgi:hypothetical protein
MAALSATVVRPWHVQASFDGANIGDMELAVRGANDWLGMVKRDNLLVECAMCGHEFRRGTPEPPAFFVCLKKEIATGHVGAAVKPICATCAEYDDDDIIRHIIDSWGGNSSQWDVHDGIELPG